MAVEPILDHPFEERLPTEPEPLSDTELEQLETSRKRGFEILPRLTCGNRAEKLRVVLFHPKRWFSTEPSHITHGLRRKAFALQA